jgi:tripartite-type tricarboxylate transporter receptor subunit TctC
MRTMHWTAACRVAIIVRKQRPETGMVTKFDRRRMVAATAAMAAWAAAPALRAQEAWPSRPVKLLIPFPPGGGADAVGRLVGQRLAALWGQPVVIDNRPGASTMIASEAVARSAPDGYTLVLSVSNHSSNPAMFAKVPYDTVKDFTPLVMLGSAPAVLVTNPKLPVRTTREVIALLREKPGKLSYGSAGNGSIGHWAGELFKQMAKVDMVHVPYKGTGPAELDLIGGTLDLMFTGVVTAAPQIRAGRMRGIAVAGRTRSEVLPELPTVADELPGFESGIWYGLLGPAGMQVSLVQRIYRDTLKVMQEPEVRQKLVSTGAEPIGMAPDAFRDYIVAEVSKFQQLARSAGIKPE